MIARKKIPQRYTEWNEKWDAPYGVVSSKQFIRRILPATIFKINNNFKNNTNTWALKLKGPFSVQINSSTRIYEYPWAFEMGNTIHKQKVLDIGGGFGGLQFVLSKMGHKVTTIDPGDSEYSWKYNSETFESLNSASRTNVKLVPTTLDKADISSSSIDTVYCISVIEHLNPVERKILLKNVYRVLKKGGKFIITVDLFLDIFPFTEKTTNQWGSNVSISDIAKESKLKLVVGDKSELFGFPEFKVNYILENLSDYMIGATYPVLAQLCVLQK